MLCGIDQMINKIRWCFKTHAYLLVFQGSDKNCNVTRPPYNELISIPHVSIKPILHSRHYPIIGVMDFIVIFLVFGFVPIVALWYIFTSFLLQY